MEAEAGSGAAEEDDGSSGSAGYFPYKPFCGSCGKDLTTVTAYDDDTTELTYVCTEDGFTETVHLSEFNRGKLVWKVDWPMRWAYEGVIFEPSGVDHSSPGSSFQVGGQIVGIFGGERPIGPMYAFVGISGMAKMSSSKGGVPTPADALQIMEPQLLRWLYARRRPNQSFKIAFDQEIQRLYDEWDKLDGKVAEGSALPADLAAHARAVRTATGELPRTPRPMPYRTLASVADITAGAEDQTLRILSELDPADPLSTLDEVRPRLDRAEAWINTHVPADQRTIVRDEPDTELLTSLDEPSQQSLRLLRDGLADHWSLDGLSHLVYGVPKVQAGFSADATAKELPPEIKTAQRTFFALLYHLLVGRDTGPRLPTLLLAVGQERVRRLLGSRHTATTKGPLPRALRRSPVSGDVLFLKLRRVTVGEAGDHPLGLALRERDAVRGLHVAPELARGRVAAVYRLLEDLVVLVLGQLRATAGTHLTGTAGARRDREGTGVLHGGLRSRGGLLLLLERLLLRELLLLLEPPLLFEPLLFLLVLLELLCLLLLRVPLAVGRVRVVRRVVAALVRHRLRVP